ncbi:MAG: hypothetical protein UW09_C0003G0040 [candidate division TM6 bacterium GW2011_GWF2_43_87]|nr:MAG: hypothetical protein UW09_C0003G0040 [candidate division TM6 bacterium GW2011_GWF2_43_87]
MQPTVQSPATPSLPSNFNNLVKKLYSAIENDDVKQTETLLKKQPANVVKALLESKDKNSRSTPLHNAMNQSNDMITLLLKYGAPIIATDKCSDTPFQCCIEHHTFLTNLQTNNTTNFNTFQAPITQPQFTPQRFFEPQLQNTLNGLFLQTSKFPASHPLNPDKSQTKFAT